LEESIQDDDSASALEISNVGEEAAKKKIVKDLKDWYK
jgi:hypothetical protein